MRIPKIAMASGPKLAAAMIAVTLLVPAADVRAQGSRQEREACTPDVFRLCAAQIPNVDAIVSCLNRKKSQLSPACRVVMNGGDKSASRR